jgi:hypothetical protein
MTDHSELATDSPFAVCCTTAPWPVKMLVSYLAGPPHIVCSWSSGQLLPLQQLRQLSDVEGDPPRLAHRHLVRADTLRRVIAIGVGNRLSARILNAPAALRADDRPWRREATGHQ